MLTLAARRRRGLRSGESTKSGPVAVAINLASYLASLRGARGATFAAAVKKPLEGPAAATRDGLSREQGIQAAVAPAAPRPRCLR